MIYYLMSRGIGESLSIFITSMRGIKNLTSFLYRFFPLQETTRRELAFGAAERN